MPAPPPTPVSPRTDERVYGDATRAPDNTGINKRDRDNATLTPGDQAENETDRELTRQLRRAITANDVLSTTAKNIKIITANGEVTLRGPVKSDAEKQEIDKIVQQMGITKVNNMVEVKPTTQADTEK
jgi:osmotically-inducible protein OsmY